MDAKHFGCVQRRMPAEKAPPDDRDDRGRDHNLRKARQILLLDLAARHAQLDQGAHAGQPARNHFAVVEIGDARKPRALGDDQTDDFAAAGVEDRL